MPLDSLQVPPYFIGPQAIRPELIVDEQGVFVADPAGTYVGMDNNNLGRGGPLARLAYASRTDTRDL